MVVSKIKYCLLVLCCISFYATHAQETPSSTKSVSFGLNLGLSHLHKWDKDVHSFSNMVVINHRQTLNLGLDLKIALNRKKKWLPQILFGINGFQSKGENKDTSFSQPQFVFVNRFLSLNGAMLYSFQVKKEKWEKINFYAGGYTNKILLRRASSKNPDDASFYTTTKIISESFSLGALIGADYPLKKFKIGLYYYQRLYFTNFNREISRIVLRVSI